MPNNAVSFICNDVRSTVDSWLESQAGTYNKKKPYAEINCLTEQVLLPENLLNGEGNLTSFEGTINNPLNYSGVVKFLENKRPSLKNSKFVTIFHYAATDIQFYNIVYSSKYDFGFIKTPNPSIPLYPPLTIDQYGKEMVHEMMHKLGASDHYDGVQQACLIDPETGQQYDSCDIMCHRVLSETGGFIEPPLSSLKVTEATAREISWSKLCGNNGICERVKCFFENSNVSQKCYSEKGNCEGIRSCIVTIGGNKGQKLGWGSDCDGSYFPMTIKGLMEGQIFQIESFFFNCNKNEKCANGLVDEGESCDKNNFGGKTCQSFGFSSGDLSCSPNCKIFTEKCVKSSSSCGNGVCEEGEDIYCPPCTKLNPRCDAPCTVGTCPKDCATDSCTKYYTCSDGTKVKECEPKGTACSCLVNPGSLCSQTKCTDSDGGIDYYLKGTAFSNNPYSGGTKTDFCATGDGKLLFEYSCTKGGQPGYPDNYYITIDQYKCPDGCKDGACLLSPPPKPAITKKDVINWIYNNCNEDMLDTTPA